MSGSVVVRDCSNNAVFDFACVEGSHVFFDGGNGEDFFSEWEDLSEAQREKFLALRDMLSNSLNTINSELSQVLPIALPL